MRSPRRWPGCGPLRPRPRDLGWGTLHRLGATHPAARTPLQHELFDLPPRPHQGGASTLASAFYTPPGTFDTRLGASYRLLAELGPATAAPRRLLARPIRPTRQPPLRRSGRPLPRRPLRDDALRLARRRGRCRDANAAASRMTGACTLCRRDPGHRVRAISSAPTGSKPRPSRTRATPWLIMDPTTSPRCCSVTRTTIAVLGFSLSGPSTKNAKHLETPRFVAPQFIAFLTDGSVSADSKSASMHPFSFGHFAFFEDSDRLARTLS